MNFMKNISTIGITLCLVAFMGSCQEDKIELYSGPDAISISAVNAVSFSFLSVPMEVNTHDFILRLTALGHFSDKNRIVKLAAGEGTTANANMYTLPTTVTIPAGAYIVEIPVTVMRDGAGETDDTLLEVQVEPSDDFLPGLTTVIRYSYNKSFPRIWYSTGPPNMLSYFMGKCDLAKYQFVYEFLGTIDLIDWADGFGTQTSILTAALNAAIDAYNAANPDNPLKDSDGLNMRFSPST